MVWLGPDGRRYLVTLVAEPFDDGRQSVIFRCDDGHIVATAARAEDLLGLASDDLNRLLRKANR
jgi:hypothetical protein